MSLVRLIFVFCTGALRSIQALYGQLWRKLRTSAKDERRLASRLSNCAASAVKHFGPTAATTSASPELLLSFSA